VVIEVTDAFLARDSKLEESK